jgi:hypothetical protein
MAAGFLENEQGRGLRLDYAFFFTFLRDEVA